MERKKATDFPQGLLDLFDRYVHGDIGRRDFLEGAQKFTAGGLTATAIWESLRPNYAWAQQVPKDDVFRGFAEELGLDLEQYDADYASDEVLARVRKDVADGEELGVQGTPTFYIDGKLFQPESVQDFSDALDEALAK